MYHMPITNQGFFFPDPKPNSFIEALGFYLCFISFFSIVSFSGILVVFLSEGHVYQILTLQHQVEQELDKVKSILADISSPETEDESNENPMVIEYAYGIITQLSISHGCMMNLTKELAGTQIVCLLGSWASVAFVMFTASMQIWRSLEYEQKVGTYTVMVISMLMSFFGFYFFILTLVMLARVGDQYDAMVLKFDESALSRGTEFRSLVKTVVDHF